MDRRSSVEIQAVSVEDAVRLALEQLGRSRDEVDIEILAEPRGNGLDEDEALVRVTVRGQASQPTQPVRGTRPAQPRRAAQQARPAVADLPVELDEETNAAIAVASEQLAAMGFQVRVVPQLVEQDDPESPPTIRLNILGKDLSVLIGRRGEHLSQLQYLISLLVNRRLGRWTHVTLDVEGYRQRREESLVGLAERVARQVARSGRAIQLEPMPAAERRIVHIALRDDPEVITESSGEGEMRRVAIMPRG